MCELCFELVVEYLVMVVILVEVKLWMLLLCLVSEEGDEVDLCVELVCWLQEYECFKQVVEDIDVLFCQDCDIMVVYVFMFECVMVKLLLLVDLKEMLLVLYDVFKCVELFSGYVIKCEVLSVWQCMGEVLGCLEDGKFYCFEGLFIVEEGKLGVLVMFLVVLELVKEQLLDIVQEELLVLIYVKLLVVGNINVLLQFSSEFDDNDVVNVNE